MMNRAVKVYVGCALTHAPKRYKKQIAIFKNLLRNVPWIQVLDFVTANSLSEVPDPLHIYTHDIHDCVGKADVIIAELSYPSTGLGWELGTSVEKHGIRTMMYIKKKILLSSLPKGAPLHQRNKHVSLDTYERSIVELLPDVLKELETVHKKIQKKKE